MCPLAARAQQAGRTYRLGVLHNQGPQSPQFPPFYDELRRLGFVEGQNLIVDSRGYAVRTEQFPAVVAELVKAQVDAILRKPRCLWRGKSLSGARCFAFAIAVAAKRMNRKGENFLSPLRPPPRSLSSSGPHRSSTSFPSCWAAS